VQYIELVGLTFPSLSASLHRELLYTDAIIH